MSVLSQKTKTRRGGNVQKLNYGSPGNAPFASPEQVCGVPGDENAGAEMFKNLTMDRPATHPSLHQNMSLFSQETKARRCGNVQKLNYGFAAEALFPSRRAKTNYGKPGQRRPPSPPQAMLQRNIRRGRKNFSKPRELLSFTNNIVWGGEGGKGVSIVKLLSRVCTILVGKRLWRRWWEHGSVAQVV